MDTIVNFQAATRRMGVQVRAIHLGYTLLTTQGVQLSGKVPFVIFEWLVQAKGFLKSELFYIV